eukprot:COSAG01_NODE_20632_length_944_cov_0.678107_1_plen_196_part_01
MVLAPWDNPLPLTRAWCLWELYSTHAVGADFRVCLGPEERRAFEDALRADSTVVIKAFARIDVQNAEAGEKKDALMIKTAVRESVGFPKLNEISFNCMRDWVCEVARGAVAKARRERGLRRTLADWQMVVALVALLIQQLELKREAQTLVLQALREGAGLEVQTYATASDSVIADRLRAEHNKTDSVSAMRQSWSS